MPKHLPFAQINKKFQSDVNNKIIVLKLIVSRKKKYLRIEPKQLRKTVIHTVMAYSCISFFDIQLLLYNNQSLLCKVYKSCILLK